MNEGWRHRRIAGHKIGCGLVCLSLANPLSDKRETSVSQLQTPTHSILFHSFHHLLHSFPTQPSIIPSYLASAQGCHIFK